MRNLSNMSTIQAAAVAAALAVGFAGVSAGSVQAATKLSAPKTVTVKKGKTSAKFAIKNAQAGATCTVKVAGRTAKAVSGSRGLVVTLTVKRNRKASTSKATVTCGTARATTKVALKGGKVAKIKAVTSGATKSTTTDDGGLWNADNAVEYLHRQIKASKDYAQNGGADDTLFFILGRNLPRAEKLVRALATDPAKKVPYTYLGTQAVDGINNRFTAPARYLVSKGVLTESATPTVGSWSVTTNGTGSIAEVTAVNGDQVTMVGYSDGEQYTSTRSVEYLAQFGGTYFAD
jgi:hypothetical protein